MTHLCAISTLIAKGSGTITLSTAHHQSRIPGLYEAQNRSLQIVTDLDTVELWDNLGSYLPGRYRRYG